MSASLAETMKKNERQQRPLLSLYLTAGFPEVAATPELLHLLDQNGADLIELGMPFSDPLADGPTIQRSSQRALANGMTAHKVLDLARGLAPTLQAPLILMGYLNPILRFGLERFVAAAAQAGVQGLIIPDLPPEESADLRTFAAARHLSLIFLVSPNTSPERVQLIEALTTSFMYAVSVTGVTGARTNLATQTEDFLARLRRQVRVPVLVGFGISTRQDAAALARHSAGVIVGSALLNIIEKNWKQPGGNAAIAGFVRDLRAGLDQS